MGAAPQQARDSPPYAILPDVNTLPLVAQSGSAVDEQGLDDHGFCPCSRFDESSASRILSAGPA